MGLAAKLQLRQSQSLVMTPQLLQSIRLLQYGRVELAAFVDAEVERNPLLEIGGEAGGLGEGEGDASPDAAEADARPEALLDAAGAERPLDGRAAHDAALRDGFAAAAGADRDEAGHAPIRLERRGEGGAGTGGGGSVEDLPGPRPSLSSHALAEVDDILADPFERRVGVRLVDHLDEAGYLRLDAADEVVLGVPRARLDAVLAKLQDGAEPAGLFARDLSECLAIQLRRRGRLDPVMATVLEHLDLLARRDFPALRRLTGEDEDGLLDILAEIRCLDPRPGHAFERDAGEIVVPDVLVDEAPGGGWRVELNPDALPRVLVRGDYARTVLAAPDARAAERGWLAERQQSAQWLVRSLDQRARTILKVAAEIVRRQDGFLNHGLSALRPMTLAAVADSVALHESTVSRVTSGKYVATPRGTFEMKFFFTVAISSSRGGDAHSAEAVKLRIRRMIETETGEAVLSDDDIAARLGEEGIELARRTVAKYREGLGLASSVQRRRELKARRLAS